MPCNYNVIQFVSALSRRSHGANRESTLVVCTALPSARKTLDLGSRELDIRTPEMQSGADCFAKVNKQRIKLTGSFTGSWPCPAVTISDL